VQRVTAWQADPNYSCKPKHQQRKIKKTETDPRNAGLNFTKYISERPKLVAYNGQSEDAANSKELTL